MPMAQAVRLCPSLVIVPPDFSRYKAASTAIFSIYREVTPLVEPLSLDEAYLDVTENSWGEPLATRVAKRLKERIREATGADRVGRRRAEQVPRQDRVGLEEAGRPDRDRARSRRAISPAAAGRRAVGRRAGDGQKAARARHQPPGRCPGHRRQACCARRSAAWPTGCGSSRTASTIGPSSPHREPKSSGSENTYAEDLTDLETIRREIEEMARHAVELARAQGTARANRHDQGPLLRLHDHHAQPHGCCDPRRGGIVSARRAASGENRGRAAARPAAGRERPQSFVRRLSRRQSLMTGSRFLSNEIWRGHCNFRTSRT